MNQRFNTYMSEYFQSHQNPTNQKIHLFAVPAISLSVLGMLQCVPVPALFPTGLNWAVIFVLLCLAFYASFKDPVLMAKVVVFMAAQFALLSLLGSPAQKFWICLGIFIVAWIFQFHGHKVEGKKPSFFRDIFFLLIGPLWVLRKLKLL